MNHNYPGAYFPEEAKGGERKGEESAFEPRAAPQDQPPAPLIQVLPPNPSEKESKPESFAPDRRQPSSSQAVPRIPIPEAVEQETMHHPSAMQYAQMMHGSMGQTSQSMVSHINTQPAPSAPKPHKPAAAAPEMHPPYTTPQMTSSMQTSQGFPGSGHGTQIQLGLLSQLNQLQQQQALLQNMLNTCGMMQQTPSPYMQMLNYVQSQMMPGKMPFAPTPTFGGPSGPGMARPMQQMMGSEMPPQYGPFTGGMSAPRMMGNMPMYAPPSAPPAQRNEAPAPPQTSATSYQPPATRATYGPPEQIHQYQPAEQSAPQPMPKEPVHMTTGLTPTKPIPQHPKTPNKIPPRISPVGKRMGGGLDNLIKVAVESEKKSGKPGQLPQTSSKANVVTIPFTAQHSALIGAAKEEEPGEERKQGESTLVKLSMSPQRPGETEADIHAGKRRKPDSEFGREPGADRDAGDRSLNKKSKPDSNN